MSPLKDHGASVMMRTFNASNFHDLRGIQRQKVRKTSTSPQTMDRFFSASNFENNKNREQYFKETWSTKFGIAGNEKEQNALIDQKLQEIETKLERHKQNQLKNIKNKSEKARSDNQITENRLFNL